MIFRAVPPILFVILFLSSPVWADALNTEELGAKSKYTNCISQVTSFSQRKMVYGLCKALCLPHIGGDVPGFGVLSCESIATSWCQKQACSQDSGCIGMDQACPKTDPDEGTGGDTKMCNGRRIPASQTCSSPSPSPSPSPAPGPKKKDKPNGGRQTAESTTPKPRNDAQNEANQDIQQCGSLQSRANTCCNNPAACGAQTQNQPAPPPQNGTPQQNQASMQEYCRQMNASGANNVNANQSAGQVCYSSYSGCTSSCGQLVSKYEALLARCSGCESQQVYQQTLNDLRGKVGSCEGFASKLSAMGSQGLASGTTTSAAAQCQALSQANPSSMPGGGGAPPGSNPTNPASMGNPNDPYGCQANPSSAACQQCSSNPGSPACQALAYEKEAKGQASFNAGEQAANSGKGSGFDIPDENAAALPGLDSDPQGFQPQGVKNGTIANNAGGGIPGGGGGSPASLGGGRRGGSPGSPGYTTDVLQGFNGAGGYSAAAGDAGTDGGGGGFGGYGGGRVPATDENGIDLRRFLPGGDKDPKRRGIAGLDLNSAQINGKFVNIWNRISDRMQEKCRLGELIGCD